MSNSNKLKILGVKDHPEGMTFRFKNQSGKPQVMCTDQMPSDLLLEALESLKQDVLAVCELPDDFGKSMKFQELVINHGKERKDGSASITAKVIFKKLLKQGEMLVVTPTKHLDSPKKTVGSVMWSRETIERIEAVQKHAVLNIKGERHYVDLFRQIVEEAEAQQPQEEEQEAVAAGQ